MFEMINSLHLTYFQGKIYSGVLIKLSLLMYKHKTNYKKYK